MAQFSNFIMANIDTPEFQIGVFLLVIVVGVWCAVLDRREYKRLFGE